MSRRIELTDAEGRTTSHELSIITVDEQGYIELTPYAREVHSVEYVDGVLRLTQDKAGRWHKNPSLD